MALLAGKEMVVIGISGVSQSTACFPGFYQALFGLSLSMKGTRTCLTATVAVCGLLHAGRKDHSRLAATA